MGKWQQVLRLLSTFSDSSEQFRTDGNVESQLAAFIAVLEMRSARDLDAAVINAREFLNERMLPCLNQAGTIVIWIVRPGGFHQGL